MTSKQPSLKPGTAAVPLSRARRHGRRWVAAGLALLLGLACSSSQAQWLTQTNTIPSGWSAVYFYVDASSQNLGQLITNNPTNPIDEIWMWKYPAGAAQYLTSPESPLSGGGQWATWERYPTNTPNTLTAIIPNTAYLVHSTSSTTYKWTVQGQPAPPSYTWDTTGLNFIGFATPPANPPSFQTFFAQDPAIASIVQIYQYSGGPFSVLNPKPVFSQYSTPVTRGQAYWVSATNVNNTYFGPFSLTLPNAIGLQYGTNLGQFTLRIINDTTNTLTVSAELLPSETPPYGQTPIVGTPPLLVEGAVNTTNLTYGYTSLNVDTSTSWTLAPSGQAGSDIQVVLGVNRFALTNAPGSLYAGILQFTDSLGFSQVNVPVSANAGNNAGLWVGTASISQVGSYLKSYATNADGSLQTVNATNVVLTTNAIAVTGTNIVINNFATTNRAVTYFRVTNSVASTYTTNATTVATFGLVAVTNQVVNTYASVNDIITTTVTGYSYSGGYIVWQTQNTTNVVTGATTSTTNFVVATNLVAAVANNGTLVTVTNQEIDYLETTNLVTTNGVFQAPVSTYTLTYQTVTNHWLATGPAYNAVATNVVTSITTSNYVTAASYAITNLTISAYTLTNTVAATPLAIFTNGLDCITIDQQINNFYRTTIASSQYQTNYQHITNFFLLGPGGATLTAGITNSVTYGTSPLVSTTVATNYATTSLILATNIAFQVQSNLLITPGASYVVASINTNLGAVVTPFPVRLILFSDGTNTSLLQRVYYGIRQNTNIVVATTESVLDTTHLNTARRITATSFPWTAANTPWAFSGPLTTGGVLTTTVTDVYDDQAANPFLHTYHPDHNNLTAITDPTVPPNELPRGSESYDITRQISLQIVPNTANFTTLTTANSSLTGNYLETITLTGLGGATRNFTTAGTFSLIRISPIATLTTQ